MQNIGSINMSRALVDMVKFIIFITVMTKSLYLEFQQIICITSFVKHITVTLTFSYDRTKILINRNSLYSPSSPVSRDYTANTCPSFFFSINKAGQQMRA
jgi:hypothetical protein